MARILKDNKYNTGRLPIDTVRAAFVRGWQDGRRLGERTMRQALQDYPTMPYVLLGAYLQGTVDGAAGDRFRINA